MANVASQVKAIRNEGASRLTRYISQPHRNPLWGRPQTKWTMDIHLRVTGISCWGALRLKGNLPTRHRDQQPGSFAFAVFTERSGLTSWHRRVEPGASLRLFTGRGGDKPRTSDDGGGGTCCLSLSSRCTACINTRVGNISQHTTCFV